MASLPEPSQPFGRAELLGAYLDYFRDTAVERLRGLPADEITRPTVPSGWSMLELLNHLVWAERRWMRWGFLGEDIADPWGDRTDGRWQLDAGVDLDDVVAALDDQARRTREVLAAYDLDTLGAPGPRWREGPPASLERVMLHLVQEWARHLGHLDIVVELAGGPTGE